MLCVRTRTGRIDAYVAWDTRVMVKLVKISTNAHYKFTNATRMQHVLIPKVHTDVTVILDMPVTAGSASISMNA